MSFDRRPKRIAGPGFHVNVRYDDETAAQMRSGITSNTNLPRSNSDECYDVKEMELLVTKRVSAMYRDGYTHCFSMLNGYTSDKLLNKTGNDLESAILKDLKFVGVAVTEYKPSKAYSEQGFVAQVGGVVTLLNESSDTIKPGQKVRIGVELNIRRNITRDKGIPREKIRFCIKPAVDTETMINEANPNKTPIEHNDLEEFLDNYRQMHDLVIGKALGLAKPGDRVEVLLQPRHAY